MDGPLVDTLVRSRRFFTKGTVSEDLRTLSKVGGREADDYAQGSLEPRQAVRRPMA
jgi:nitrate reductase alpha subunit